MFSPVFMPLRKAYVVIAPKMSVGMNPTMMKVMIPITRAAIASILIIFFFFLP